GLVGIEISGHDALFEGLIEGFSYKDRLVFEDIDVDPTEHVYPMHVAPNGSMRDMWLKKGVRT
ncbi:MAG: acetolactate synthase 3 large subunit, partial [Pseudomonadales bacterium]